MAGVVTDAAPAFFAPAPLGDSSLDAGAFEPFFFPAGDLAAGDLAAGDLAAEPLVTAPLAMEVFETPFFIFSFAAVAAARGFIFFLLLCTAGTRAK